jgi:tetratricopeptide (TPR) repeat protein
VRKASLVLAAAFPLMLSLSALGADAGALIRRGETELQAGQFGAAIATLQQAIAADPNSSLAYTRLGGAQVLNRDYAAGIQSFKQAIMLDGKNGAAFVGMAVAYLHQGEDALARTALEEAKKVDPSKQEEVDKVISLIDQRTGTAPSD